MTPWIGRWLMAVAALHTAFAVVVFGPVLRTIAERGVFDAVGRDANIGAVAWFVLFGVLLFICGLAVSALESASCAPLPKPLGWSLLGLATIGVVLMPASGFWLAFPPAVAALVRKPKACMLPAHH